MIMMRADARRRETDVVSVSFIGNPGEVIYMDDYLQRVAHDPE